MKRRARTAGTTLLETVAAVTVLALVSLVAGFALSEAGRVQARVAPRWACAQEAEGALERMKRELRALPGPAALRRLAPNELAFVDGQGQLVTYRWTGAELHRNADLLAAGVSAFELTYRSPDGRTTATPSELALIELACTVARGPEQATARALVFPRGLAR